ncbi:helix-turn-helix transcriptional regulator [Agromyces aurantiacus]|uniref:Helix-turn-helix transcriptional regulator n=1 Tax=Agromyces aurantiacus TaxID=165814 RepID=A0ABV9R6W5_9MICO|nr:hypothetical protein [Agromyces aurantiacus]MBM7504209.1 DNA-binding CsgD family transcriptional regulator/PAS domain-containing protein [Agromyces aurantiacus]
MANAGLPAEAIASYEAYYGRLDHVARHFQLPGTGIDVALPADAFVGWEDRHRSEFFHDWAEPIGMGVFIAGTAFWRKDAVNWLAVVGRPDQSSITDNDSIRAFRGLLPHIRRAADLHTRLDEAAARFAGAADALSRFPHAVALIGDGGRLSYTNPAGEALFATRDGLWIDRGGVLHAQRSSDEAALRRLILLATRGNDLGVRSGGRIVIAREACGLPLLLFVVPTGRENSVSSAIVVGIAAEKPSTVSVTALQELFGLTRAEAETARRVVRGLGLQHAAEDAGVTLSTVRAQLQRVFEKTGTHRQAELVSLVDSLQLRI